MARKGGSKAKHPRETPKIEKAERELNEKRIDSEGVDVEGPDYDAHVRLERGKVAVDVFNSKIKDNSKAWENSEMFPKTVAGLREAEDFLADYGIKAYLKL